MKGVKRRFANVRNIAIFISIFMFISLFSNITVKADELEDGEVNLVVSEQAEIQSNEEFDAENELLIPEETTDYEDAQNDEVTSADLTGSGEELSEESKEELPTAEEANKQEEFFQEEILEEEIFEDEKEAEGAITEEEEEVIVPEETDKKPSDESSEIEEPKDETNENEEPKEDEECNGQMKISLLINGEEVNYEDNVSLNEDDDIDLRLKYNTIGKIKAGDTLEIKIPSFINVKDIEYEKMDFSEESISDDGTVKLIFNERILDVGQIYIGEITISGTIAHTEESVTEGTEVLVNGAAIIGASITAIPKVNTEPNPEEPAEEVYMGSVVLTNVERGNNEKVLDGSKFILLDENLDKVGDIYTTNEQGQITVDNLIEGDYYFVEIAPKAGYALDMIPVKFTISKDNEGPVLVFKENSLIPKLNFPNGNGNVSSGSTINKLSGLSMASKLSTNTSTNYRRTLPNTGGNSKAVELVVAFAAILIGFIFVRKNKKNNVT